MSLEWTLVVLNCHLFRSVIHLHNLSLFPLYPLYLSVWNKELHNKFLNVQSLLGLQSPLLSLYSCPRRPARASHSSSTQACFSPRNTWGFPSHCLAHPLTIGSVNPARNLGTFLCTLTTCAYSPPLSQHMITSCHFYTFFTYSYILKIFLDDLLCARNCSGDRDTENKRCKRLCPLRVHILLGGKQKINKLTMTLSKMSDGDNCYAMEKIKQRRVIRYGGGAAVLNRWSREDSPGRWNSSRNLNEQSRFSVSSTSIHSLYLHCRHPNSIHHHVPPGLLLVSLSSIFQFTIYLLPRVMLFKSKPDPTLLFRTR